MNNIHRVNLIEIDVIINKIMNYIFMMDFIKHINYIVGWLDQKCKSKSKPSMCRYCLSKFSSKNKLFKHLYNNKNHMTD